MAKEIKNRAKGESYKNSFDQITLGLEKGFPLESIALIESILSDRLLSNAVGAKQLFNKPEKAVKTSFYDLIKFLKEYAKETNDKEAAQLAAALDGWRDRRNMLIHAAVKSYPKTPPKMPPPEFWMEAARVARQGLAHARQLLRWHQRKLRAIRTSALEERTHSMRLRP